MGIGVTRSGKTVPLNIFMKGMWSMWSTAYIQQMVRLTILPNFTVICEEMHLPAAQTQSVTEGGSALQGQMQATDADYNAQTFPFAIANPVDGFNF
ncbi:hypothetical protein O9992_30285 [Vibrio lentus]|nr:hypothetical protein [Vibrio lentus]